MSQQDLIKAFTDFIPEDIMSTGTVQGLLKSGNLQEVLSKKMAKKSLKERRALGENMDRMRKAVVAAEHVDRKYCILITSSRKVKKTYVGNLDNLVPPKNRVEKLFKLTKLKGDFSPAEAELLGDSEIFVTYDSGNLTINRKATQLLGYPVGGDVVFSSKSQDLEVEDIL